ncbi:MAG: four helix bundle protein [bacterium]|nr:four helix bundle protein [bacterium]
MSYQNLKSYKQAVIIADFTVAFCNRYISKFSRTVDQMTQAARSGKQNIVEGTAVSQTSPNTELKLVGVARGSLEELLEDYKDFLRQRGLRMWAKHDPRALALRQLAYADDRPDKTYTTYKTYESYKSYLDDPEEATNAMITLINQTNFLLDRQMAAIRRQFEERGITAESHNQRLRRNIVESRRKNEMFDAEMQVIVEASKKKRKQESL